MTVLHHVPLRIGVYPYESPLDGVNSDSDAVEQAITDVMTETNVSCRIQWTGPLTLTRPLPVLDRVVFEGDDALNAAILKKYAGGVMFNWGGRVGYSGGGLLNCNIPLTEFTGGMYTILSRSRADGYSADMLRLEYLYLGSGANAAWLPWRHIELIGSGRTSPLGIRGPRLISLDLFGTTGGHMYLDSLVAARLDRIGAYQAPGPSAVPSYIVNCHNTVGSALSLQCGRSMSGNVSSRFTDTAGNVL